ncbi:MAG: DapH/DapD/GlmU-related protein [Lawsonella clevelandensis]
MTPIHPIDDVEMRAAGWERSAPIVVGDNVWIAAGVTVCAGVTIGENSVIGSGSVVTRDIPGECAGGGYAVSAGTGVAPAGGAGESDVGCLA